MRSKAKPYELRRGALLCWALLTPAAYAAGAVPTPDKLADMLFEAKANGEHACAGRFCQSAPAADAKRPRIAIAADPGRKPPPQQLLDQIVRAAGLHRLDPYLVQAVVQVESNFNTHAVSAKNARGLMQVLPSTASEMGLQPAHRVSVAQRLHDPWVGLTIGSRYLAEQLLQFDGQVTLALAAYNAGPAAVRRSGNRVPPIRETQDYVRKVLRAQHELEAAQTSRDAPA
jgi:soluble lytic murein transglycosylase-like protein